MTLNNTRQTVHNSSDIFTGKTGLFGNGVQHLGFGKGGAIEVAHGSGCSSFRLRKGSGL